MNQFCRVAIATVSLSTSALITPVQSFHLPKNAATNTDRSFTSNTWPLSSTVTSPASVPSSSWFTDSNTDDQQPSKKKLKTQILQLGAALDRGQSYNPTSGEYYSSWMDVARSKIQSLVSLADADSNIPKSLEDISGEWELVFTTVKHGIFCSSPFFLAVQEAFEYGEEKEAFGEDKATLFFKLHEL